MSIPKPSPTSCVVPVRSGRFPLAQRTPLADVLAHLRLLEGKQPTTAAMLLFGRDPQRFVSCAEVRCMHFHGTEIQRPAPYYQIFKGRLFEQVDRAADFVLSVLNLSVGMRELSAQAPVAYEVPPNVVREAIVNAMAHRDYASAGARAGFRLCRPHGGLESGRAAARTHAGEIATPHGSVPRNHRALRGVFFSPGTSRNTGPEH